MAFLHEFFHVAQDVRPRRIDIDAALPDAGLEGKPHDKTNETVELRDVELR